MVTKGKLKKVKLRLMVLFLRVLFLRGALLLGLSVLTTACSAGTSLYRWGDYEPLLYQMYAEEGGGDPQSQLARLSEDVGRTIAEGRRVPPGVHAHLGYLYYSQGDVVSARKHFIAEKELFPESAVFIDGILGRMDKKR